MAFERHPMSVGRTFSYGVIGVMMGAFIAVGQSNVAVAPVIDTAAYQRLVDENLDLRREQTRLIREANDLRRRNASLVLQVQELERKQESLSAVLADLRSPDELKAEVDRVRKERDTLSREVERIRAEAKTTAGGAPVQTGPVPVTGSDLYRKLERENAELRAQVAAAVAASKTENQAHAAASLRETQLAAQVEEVGRELAVQRREGEQAAAREALLRTALVKVARKVYGYETALREAEARKTAQVAATNTVIVGGHSRRLEPAMLDTARQCVVAGRYRDAERLYLTGIKRDPTNAQFHYNLGVLYDDYLQNPREAAVHYRKYLELNPTAADAAIVRSWLLDLDVQSR